MLSTHVKIALTELSLLQNIAEFFRFLVAILANSRMHRAFAVFIMQLLAGQAAGVQIAVEPALRYRIIKASEDALVNIENERYVRL